jgi:drug/metabolite transporter (DMT)-like permease
MRIDPAMDRRVLAVLTGVAVVAAGVMFLLRDVSFAFALSYTNVGVAAALSALDPLIIAPLGYFFLKERMTRIQVGGLGVALIGSVLALVG